MMHFDYLASADVLVVAIWQGMAMMIWTPLFVAFFAPVSEQSRPSFIYIPRLHASSLGVTCPGAEWILHPP